jgi:hypothetical protein
LFFLALGSRFLNEKKWLLCGISFGIAIQMREYLALIALFFLWKRHWRALAGLIGSIVFLRLATCFLYGVSSEISYWQRILSFYVMRLHFDGINHAFSSTIGLWGAGIIGMSGVRLVTILWAVSIITFSLFLISYKKGSDLIGLSFFLTLCFLCTPWLHETNFPVLYLPFLVVWFSLAKTHDPKAYAVFILSYLLLGLRFSLNRFPSFQKGILPILTAWKFDGIILLFALLAMMFCHVPEAGCRSDKR